MYLRRFHAVLLSVLTSGLVLAACLGARPQKVCVVLDTPKENDKGFNEFTLKGARQAAAGAGLEFAHIASVTESDYEPNINRFVDEGCGLIITVGFLMGEATAKAAQAHPDVRFAIVDVAYYPGAGCSAELADCYTAEGELSNVTSLMFAEDEVGYLVGTLAACMSQAGVISSVSGMEIPPVVRFVTGYQNGARAFRPDIIALNEYIPSFTDPAAGKQLGDAHIHQGADVVFGVGGNTGNGGLLAAHDAGLMAIGVDVDQYATFPEVAPSLVTSAMKNMDVAAANAVESYAQGTLESGILLSTLANGGIGLAPYHEWDSRIPVACKAAVGQAKADLISGMVSTGYNP